ncbi:MAG: MBL fold metallo-hydrolase [Natronomonas sp.]
MTTIEPETLAEQIQRDSPYILDIRHEEEYTDWNIPGSVNIDVYDQLDADPELAKPALSEIPSDEEVVTVCAAGVLSQDATTVLEDLGYDVKTLVDGMNGWSRVHRSAEVEVDVEGTLVQVTRPGKGCLSYVLVSDGEAAVFDPSQYVSEYVAILEEYDASLVGVFDTHAHADHLSGGRELADAHDVQYFLHPDDALGIDATDVEDEDVHTIGEVEVTVVHTPGHSEGGVTYSIEGDALLTGDTLFHESVGRVELGVEAGIEDTSIEENAATLYESLQRIRDRAADPLILPSHDPGSPEPPVAVRLQEVVERNADLDRDRDEFVSILASDVPDHPPNFQRVKAVNVGRETVDESDRASIELGPNRCAAE